EQDDGEGILRTAAGRTGYQRPGVGGGDAVVWNSRARRNAWARRSEWPRQFAERVQPDRRRDQWGQQSRWNLHGERVDGGEWAGWADERPLCDWAVRDLGIRAAGSDGTVYGRG